MSGGHAMEMFQGNLVNIPKNVILGGAFDPNSLSRNPYSWLAGGNIANLLFYPLLTIKRRLECQSNDVGMIRKRYTGAFHGLKVIYKEEGVIKGWFRGFGGNLVVNNLMG